MSLQLAGCHQFVHCPCDGEISNRWCRKFICIIGWEDLHHFLNMFDPVFNWSSNPLNLVNCLMRFVHFKVDSSLAIPSRGLSSYLLTAILDFCNSIVLNWHCIFFSLGVTVELSACLFWIVGVTGNLSMCFIFLFDCFFNATLNWEIYSSRIVVAWMEMHCNGIFPKSDVK